MWPAEVELLVLVLREVRHATATGEQLNVTIDPWALGGGLNVFFGHSSRGWSTEVVGPVRRRRARRGHTQ